MAILKKFSLTIVLILSSIVSATAQNQPLLVAVPQFVSPFVMKGKNQLYGFDISMMSQICDMIKRDCKYQIMPFDQLLQSVIDKKVDVAIGAITITAERAKIVNFSIPYMIPDTRFIGKNSMKDTPINLKLLQQSTVGIVKGTVFANELRNMGIANAKIATFLNEGEMIAALNAGTIDLGLVDNSTAMYWQAQSGEALMALDKPKPYGFGLGIVVNLENAALLASINQALYQYQNSPEFTRNYDEYLKYF